MNKALGKAVKFTRGEVNKLNSQADELRGRVDVLVVLNTTETAAVSNGDDTCAKLDAEDVERAVDVTDDFRNSSGTAKERWNMPGIQISMDMTIGATAFISTR